MVQVLQKNKRWYVRKSAVSELEINILLRNIHSKSNLYSYGSQLIILCTAYYPLSFKHSAAFLHFYYTGYV